MPRFDEWEHGRQMAKLYREKYPPGTRMVLLGTTEERDPVPIGMRGTVHLIDDQGQMHMKWDNGRTLPLIYQDSFRKLTPEELAEERIEKFNKECSPMYICSHDDGTYTLCLTQSPNADIFGQNTFDKYAEHCNETVLDNGYHRYGTGHDWAIVFKKAFENRPEAESFKFDCELSGFFCDMPDLDTAEKCGSEFKAICDDESKFESLVREAMDEYKANPEMYEGNEAKTIQEQLHGVFSGVNENEEINADEPTMGM